MPSALYVFLGFYVFLCFHAANEASARKFRPSQTTPLTFRGPQSYAIYESWDPSPHGALQLEFKTVNREAFLMYMDEMGQREFIDLFLVNGSVRLRLTVGSCEMVTTYVHGQFHDSAWHRVLVNRREDETTLVVDTNLRSKPINCTGHSTFRVNSKIIVGSFTFPNISSQDFALGYQILWEAKQASFWGCIQGVSYWKKNKFVGSKLWRTSAEAGCRNACSVPELNKCEHGAKCIDKVFEVECLCSLHNGENCSPAILTSSLAESAPGLTNLTTSTSAHYPKPTGNSSIETKYLRNNVQGLRTKWLLVLAVTSLASLKTELS